jgi:hypothetical protein
MISMRPLARLRVRDVLHERMDSTFVAPPPTLCALKLHDEVAQHSEVALATPFVTSFVNLYTTAPVQVCRQGRKA